MDGYTSQGDQQIHCHACDLKAGLTTRALSEACKEYDLVQAINYLISCLDSLLCQINSLSSDVFVLGL